VQQLSIFYQHPGKGGDPPRARRDDPATSQLAAAKACHLAAEHRARILDALERADGTIYEIAARTELTHVQVARRMPELERAGDAATTDETRVSPSGRGCRVWARS
jgi:predicted ArsR family transcriptional regulator